MQFCFTYFTQAQSKTSVFWPILCDTFKRYFLKVYEEMKKIPQKIEIQFSIQDLGFEANKVSIYVLQTYIFITATFFD